MTCAIVLLILWWSILWFGGAGINYIAGLANYGLVSTGVATVVSVLQITGVIISIMIFLLYLWSVRKSKQLEEYLGRKKRCVIRKKNEAKENINSSITKTKKNVKDWYDKKWWAIENDG